MPYVFGADITFKGGEKYAIDPMGLCETIEEAVRGNRELHSSFGYCVYEVKPSVTHGLTRDYGFRAGTPCSGHEVVGLVCRAFDHEVDLMTLED